MEKKHYVTFDVFKRSTHWKEVAPSCAICKFFFLDEKSKEMCGHPSLRNRMPTTSSSYCGGFSQSNFV
jgi:hypothetical protein